MRYFHLPKLFGSVTCLVLCKFPTQSMNHCFYACIVVCKWFHTMMLIFVDNWIFYPPPPPQKRENPKFENKIVEKICWTKQVVLGVFTTSPQMCYIQLPYLIELRAPGAKTKFWNFKTLKWPVCYWCCTWRGFRLWANESMTLNFLRHFCHPKVIVLIACEKT